MTKLVVCLWTTLLDFMHTHGPSCSVEMNGRLEIGSVQQWVIYILELTASSNEQQHVVGLYGYFVFSLNYIEQINCAHVSHQSRIQTCVGDNYLFGNLGHKYKQNNVKKKHRMRRTCEQRIINPILIWCRFLKRKKAFAFFS